MSLFDTINQGEGTPDAATFDASGQNILISVSANGTNNEGISVNTERLVGKAPDEFFIVSAGNPSDEPDKSRIDRINTPDVFNDSRRRNISESRDELNFYIEVVDDKFRNVDIPIFEGEFRLRALRLGVNPSVLTINSAKIISRYQTLTRWVEEHWGDELDNISLQGSTLAFILFPENVLATQRGGLNTNKEGRTLPFQELQQVIRLYQTNGLIFQKEKEDDGKTVSVGVEGFNHSEFFEKHPRLGMVKQRFYIKLSYDYGIFIGYFESFDVIEDSNSPYRMTYNANFKAEKVVWK